MRVAMSGSLEDRRSRLRKLMVNEKTIFLARATINRFDQVNEIAEKIAAEEAIPCVLHMEMRMNEKVFWTVLAQALERYTDGKVNAQRRSL